MSDFGIESPECSKDLACCYFLKCVVDQSLSTHRFYFDRFASELGLELHLESIEYQLNRSQYWGICRKEENFPVFPPNTAPCGFLSVGWSVINDRYQLFWFYIFFGPTPVYQVVSKCLEYSAIYCMVHYCAIKSSIWEYCQNDRNWSINWSILDFWLYSFLAPWINCLRISVEYSLIYVYYQALRCQLLWKNGREEHSSCLDFAEVYDCRSWTNFI